MSVDQPRRTERVATAIEVEFRRMGDTRYKVDLLDMSPEGACISPPVRLDMGEQVLIRFPGIEAISAKVCWVRQWKVGLQFERPLYPAVFDNLASRMRQPGR